MLFEAYDISPRFCGALNGELGNICYQDVNFYLQSHIILLHQAYKKTTTEQAIQQLETILKEATVNFQDDLKQNENLIEFFQAILDLVFRIDVNGEDKVLCKTYKKTINKLVTFCLTFPYETESMYVDLLEQMQDSFRD